MANLLPRLMSPRRSGCASGDLSPESNSGSHGIEMCRSRRCCRNVSTSRMPPTCKKECALICLTQTRTPKSHQRKLVDGSDPTCSRRRPIRLRSLYVRSALFGRLDLNNPPPSQPANFLSLCHIRDRSKFSQLLPWVGFLSLNLYNARTLRSCSIVTLPPLNTRAIGSGDKRPRNFSAAASEAAPAPSPIEVPF